MPLVTRWGSEVRTVSPLEPGPEDPKPSRLVSTPSPVTPAGGAYNRLPFFQNPAPLKRNFQHPLPREVTDPPAAGLDINGTSLGAPVAGLDADSAHVTPPALGLDINSVSQSQNPPALGLDINSVSQSQNPPALGLNIDSASVNLPASGLDISSAAKLTLNIDIEPSQSFADDPSSGVAGEIRYASGYLYIHDGTNWHHINGA